MGNTDKTISSTKLLGFFTVLMLFTLNGDNGRDLCDVIVEYIEAKTEALRAS